ncbi:MAG: PQQ-binding-like beta-propeller repeat protein [Candidatus Symbiothrix sp.]|nr:PQQ-binding-like beta-propeller repeat protein [Candidatus Symbiothrix sp.]
MKAKMILFLVATLFSGATLFAQRPADVVIPFSQDIQQILLNPVNGHVIVKEKEVISDYNPETQKTEWTLNKKDVVNVGVFEQAQKVLAALESVAGMVDALQSDDDIYFVPGSFYVRAVLENRDIIINSLTGQIVFNSGTTDYRILESQFLPETNEFLLLAGDGKIFYAVLWDLQTGKEMWKTEIGTAASMASIIKNALLLKNDNNTEDKTELKGEAIYSSFNGILYKLNKDTGAILWKSTDKINTFYVSQTGHNIIVIKNSGGLLSSKQALNIWNSQDGKAVWKDDIKTKYIIYLEDWSDKILVAHNSGFNFYNYADGKKIWKKDAKGDDIKRIIPIGQDYLYIADKEMNLIDQNGQNKWKKFVEISDNADDPIYFLDVIGDNQVAYLTGTYGNLVDYTSGKKIWKKNIDFEKDRPVLYALDEATNTFLVYNDKKVYKFDSKTTERPEPIAKLKKVKDEKNISDIGLFDWGVSLAGEGDVIGVGSDGTIKYHNTYDEPGGSKRKFMKTAAIGLKTAKSVSQTEVVFLAKNEKGEFIETGRANLFDKKTQQAGSAAGVVGDVLLPRVTARFNAMKANNAHAFVLAKSPNGPVLIKVRKADGTEVDKIDIDNNKPIYEVDPVNDNVYYVFKNELRTYSGQ